MSDETDNPSIERRSRRGFTMIEVLVAIALLAGITTIVWASINNMFKTREFVTEQYERYQVVRVSLDRMTTELASAYDASPAHGAEEEYAQEGAAPESQEEAERETATMDREPVEFGMIGDEDELNFTTFAHTRTTEGERASYHAEIGYETMRTRNDEGDLVKSLVRREDTTIDDDITKGGKVYTLIPQIEDVEFEYWDPGEVEIGSEEEMGRGRWVDSWDTGDRQYHDRLPFRVRVTVTLPPLGPRGEEQTFSTEAQIMVHQELDL